MKNNLISMGTRIVHLEDALKLANSILNENGLLGVLPDEYVGFRESSNFYARVRKAVNKYGHTEIKKSE